MQQLQFSIEINAPKSVIWHVLWDDASFRDWANLIDPGTHLAGELRQGNTVQWLSASGYGVTSLIETFIPEERATFLHQADTQENGALPRDNEWTGGAETYALAEHDGVVTLTVELDTPPEQVELFQKIMPTVLERIKGLAEAVS